MSCRTILPVFGLAAVLSGVTLLPPACHASVFTHIMLENNRPYVELGVAASAGRRSGKFYLDTGGGAIVITSGFAGHLGMTGGTYFNENGVRLQKVSVPRVFIGNRPVSLKGPSAFVVPEHVAGLMGTDADGGIAVRSLRRYVVTLDFIQRRLWLAHRIGRRAGSQVPGHIAAIGMPVVEVRIDGRAMAFLLDTGATYSMMSAEVLKRLRARHPDWASRRGAVGAADMLIGDSEAKALMLRVRRVSLGPFQFANVGFVARPDAAYRVYMSRMLGTNVVGSLGDNIWRHYAVTLDFPDGKIRVNGPRRLQLKPKAVVLLTLERKAGQYRVAGSGAGCRAAHRGDIVRDVGPVLASGATLAHLLQGLSRPAGRPVALDLDRDGHMVRVVCHTRVWP